MIRRSSPPTRRLASVLCTCLVGGALLAPALPASAQYPIDVGVDPRVAEAERGVEQATAELDEAAQRLARVQERLDEVAGAFEAARGHAQRLTDELEAADDIERGAVTAVATARDRFSAALRQAYMYPGLPTIVGARAFATAPDAPSALHRTALVGRLAGVEAVALAEVRRSASLELDALAQHRAVQAGSAAAEADLATLQQDLVALSTSAAADVGVAREELVEAQRIAEEEAQRVEDEAAAMAAAEAATQSVVGEAGAALIAGVAAPELRQGMACPIGQPNGFVDSWGAPRSGGRTHKGVDMFAAYGMPLFAAAPGRIGRVWNNTLGGLSVDLFDIWGNRYYYAHLSVAFVVPGQEVAAGQLIAANGNSGNARFTPPHLHWQFHPGSGGPVNPYPLAVALCR